MTSCARRERLALCDTALLAGPDAPTLCAPSDVKALVCQGRARVADLTYDGPRDADARLRGADLGV
jgi:hypothetical protein